MRIVSILILLTLAAAFYVANFVAVDGPGPKSTQAPVAQLEMTTPTTSGASTGDTAPGAASGELPSEFPTELTRRSRAKASDQGASDRGASGSAASSAGSMSATGDLAGDLPLAPSTRSGTRLKGPKLKEPEGELDAQTLALLEERLAGGPAGGSAQAPGAEAAEPSAEAPRATTPGSGRTTSRRRPSREVTQPANLPDEDEVTEIVLPSKQPAPRVTAPVEPADSGVSKPAAEGTSPAEVLSTQPKQASASLGGEASAGSVAIRGRVLDTTGKAVGKVKLAVLEEKTREVVSELRADADGSFASADLASGRYMLRIDPDSVPLGVASPVESDSCRTGSEPAGYGSPCVDVVGGGSQPVEIVLPLSSGIQGTILGASGAPQKGAFVRAVSQVKGFEHHFVISKTDKDGFYFMGLAPGPYELQMLLPGGGEREDLTRRMSITAKPGSALLLDAVDFSKPDASDAKASDDRTSLAPVPAAPKDTAAKKVAALTERPGKATRSELAGERAELLRRPALKPAKVPASVPAQPRPAEQAKPSSTDPGSTVTLASQPALPRIDSEPSDPSETVELRGRIISKWGESLPALSVVAETMDGTIIEATQTSDAGRYILEDIPVGSAIIRVASDLELNRESSRGTTLLKRPAPMRVQTFSGQKRVSLEDVVVEVRRVYRLSGRIKIDPEAFLEFKKALRLATEGEDPMTDEQYRRAYYRGLRLTQRNKGARGAKGGDKGRGRPVEIAYDGSFVWQCTLPADDILLVLEPRTSRKNIGYRGAVGIPVTPAGVRPAKLEIAYPPLAEEPEEAPLVSLNPGAEDLRQDALSDSAAASAPFAAAPSAPTR